MAGAVEGDGDRRPAVHAGGQRSDSREVVGDVPVTVTLWLVNSPCAGFVMLIDGGWVSSETWTDAMPCCPKGSVDFDLEAIRPGA